MAVKIFRVGVDTKKSNVNKPIPTIIVKEATQTSFVLKRFVITKAMKPTRKKEVKGPNQRYLFVSVIRGMRMYIRPMKVINTPKATDMDTACRYWASSLLINSSNRIAPIQTPYRKSNKKTIIPVGESNSAFSIEKAKIINRPKRKDITNQALNSLTSLPERMITRQKSSGTIRVVRRKVILIQLSEFNKIGLQ